MSNTDAQTEVRAEELAVKDLGLQDYEPVYQQMCDFTDARDKNTPDEIWLLEHKPVYTLGKNSKAHHVINSGNIPVVQVDRGGQVTYHGPGQLIAYLLLDVRRRNFGVRQVVTAMETALINLLAEYGINAYAKPDAPGVYVDASVDNKGTEKKIAALGLRIRKGCSYHGLSLNIDMDTVPFNGINPCGYEGLEVAQLSNFLTDINIDNIKKDLLRHLFEQLTLN